MVGGESRTTSNGGFRSRLEYFLYSGDKKHVFTGIAIISVVFSVPWFFMTRGSFFIFILFTKWHLPMGVRPSVTAVGSKHQSHQDFMDKADKARSQRLSTSKSSEK